MSIQTGLLFHFFFFSHRGTALYEDNLDQCLSMEFTYPSSKHDRQRATKDDNTAFQSNTCSVIEENFKVGTFIFPPFDLISN